MEGEWEWEWEGEGEGEEGGRGASAHSLQQKSCVPFRILRGQSLSPVEPRFMPEGVSPASMALMAVMRDIFIDFWTG